MAGNIGGALSPIVFGVLVQFGSWQAPFIVAASLLVIGAAIWAFWLDPSVSVVEKRAAELPPDSAAASATTR
jgi:MFS family permease